MSKTDRPAPAAPERDAAPVRIDLGSAKFALGRKLYEITRDAKAWEDAAERAAALFAAPPSAGVATLLVEAKALESKLRRRVEQGFGDHFAREQIDVLERLQLALPRLPAYSIDGVAEDGALHQAAQAVVSAYEDLRYPDLTSMTLLESIVALRAALAASAPPARAVDGGAPRDPSAATEEGLGDCPEVREDDPIAFDSWVVAYNIAEHMCGEGAHDEQEYLARLRYVARECVSSTMRLHAEARAPSVPSGGAAPTVEAMAELRDLSEKATDGPWYVTTEDVDGNYGSGPDCGSGWKGYSIRSEAAKHYGKDAVVLDTINNDVGEIHEESDEDGVYAWDAPARANAHYVAALVNWHRTLLADPAILARFASGGHATPVTVSDAASRERAGGASGGQGGTVDGWSRHRTPAEVYRRAKADGLRTAVGIVEGEQTQRDAKGTPNKRLLTLIADQLRDRAEALDAAPPTTESEASRG